MQEAFERTAKDNPGSELDKQVKDAVESAAREKVEKDKRARELAELTELMRATGASWKLYESLNGETKAAYLASIRAAWEERSLGQELMSATQHERVTLLQSFASGAALDRTPLPPEYRMTLLDEIGRGNNALRLLQGALGLTQRLSPQALLVIKAYGDVAGLNDKQRSALTESVTESGGVTESTNLLNSVIKISEWIPTQQRRRPR